jgi:hypothetical protein
MIGSTDRLSLPPGVGLGDGELTDTVRGASWPLNASGAFVLARMGRPVGGVVRELAIAFAISVDEARSDVLRFVWQLNGLALLNIDRTSSRPRQLLEWARLAMRLAPAGAVPAAVSRRRVLDTGTVPRALVTALSAVLPRIVAIAALAAILALHLALVAGAGIATPVVLGLATGLGLGLHEAAHAALLRGVPSSLVVRGRRTYVLHATVSPRRRAMVAIGGPLAVATLGVVLIAGSIALMWPLLAVAGTPLAAHAFALTVASSDGRVACGL